MNLSDVLRRAVEFGRDFTGASHGAVAEERHRIARDLHDVVVQRLYISGLHLRTLVQNSRDDETRRSLSTIAGELDEVVRDLRASIYMLEGPRSGDGTVRGELWHRVREFSDVLGYEPWVSFDGPIDSAVPESVLPDLYAALREALSNVARHAGATSVRVGVTVSRDGKELTLTVDDNGSGLPGRLGRRSGLSNLEARAQQWAGALAVRSGPLGGTRLEWRILLPQPYWEAAREE